MKKFRIALIAILTVIMSVCCIALVACAAEATKFAITWKPDANIDRIEIEGYDELPTELEENTEITFTPVAKEGYRIRSVIPSASVKPVGDGSYKFTVTEDLTVTVKSEKIPNTYGDFTDCSLKIEDDKIYFVATGTYEGIASNCDVSDIYFALEDNVLMWTGGWWDNSRPSASDEWLDSQPYNGNNNGYATHSYYPEIKSITGKDDGTFEVKIDLTNLSSYWYGTLLSVGYEEDKTDFEADPFIYDWMSDDAWNNEWNGKAITFQDRTYMLHVPGEDGPDEEFGEWRKGLAIVIKDKWTTETYTSSAVTTTSYGLEVKDGKPCLVINGTVANYVADNEDTGIRYWVYFASVLNGDPWGNTVESSAVTQTFVPDEEDDGSATFTIVWDLSGLEADQSCWLHIGKSGSDLASNLADEGKLSIDVDGTTYYLELMSGEDEVNSPILYIGTPEAE